MAPPKPSASRRKPARRSAPAAAEAAVAAARGEQARCEQLAARRAPRCAVARPGARPWRRGRAERASRCRSPSLRPAGPRSTSRSAAAPVRRRKTLSSVAPSCRAGLLVQLVDGAEGDQPAALDDADPVAQLLGDLQAVRRHEHRGAVGGEVAEDALQQPRAARVHAHRRLVDDQDARRVHQRRGHDQALLHAVRVALRQLVAPLGADRTPRAGARGARRLGRRRRRGRGRRRSRETPRRSASRTRAVGRARSRTALWRAAARRAGRSRPAARRRRSARAAPSSCGWWSSCRRRWGRESRRCRRPAIDRVRRSTAIVLP